MKCKIPRLFSALYGIIESCLGRGSELRLDFMARERESFVIATYRPMIAAHFSYGCFLPFFASTYFSYSNKEM